MIELAAKLDLGEEISGIPNLVVKHNGDILHNKLSVYYNWEPPVFQDWEIFDERHLLKPFMGEMHRTGFFELSQRMSIQMRLLHKPLMSRNIQESWAI